jgi:SAM-dependent methyltransferase
MQARPASTIGEPVFYAGRFVPEIERAGLQGDYTLLNEWEVLPARLASVEGASTLVVLDPLSFPFDSLTGALLDVPLVVFLPGDLDAEFLATVFGEPVLGRLGFFDRVATADPAIWEDLRRRYRWAGGQLVHLPDAGPGEAAGEIAALLRAEASGDAMARGPGKAVHRAQRAALRPQFGAARGERAPDVPFRVLEVGAGAGRWASSFDPAEAEYQGLDGEEASVLAARSEWPGIPFDHLGPDLLFPHEDETFDLVFSVDLMGRRPDPEKGRLISEMWRVTRPGGRLLFLEDFVATGEPGSPEHVLSVRRFTEGLLAATGWQVVMEHVESLRYAGEVLTRAGVVAVSRLGVPKRW